MYRPTRSATTLRVKGETNASPVRRHGDEAVFGGLGAVFPSFSFRFALSFSFSFVLPFSICALPLVPAPIVIDLWEPPVIRLLVTPSAALKPNRPDKILLSDLGVLANLRKDLSQGPVALMGTLHRFLPHLFLSHAARGSHSGHFMAGKWTRLLCSTWCFTMPRT